MSTAKLDPDQKRAKERRERGWSFGQDSSAQLDGESSGLLEQAQDLQAEQNALSVTLALEPASARYDAAIADKIHIKQEQASRLEDRLEQLVDLQAAQLQNTLAHRPGRLSLASTRDRWQQQAQQQQASLQRLQGRLQIVREIKDGLGATGSQLHDLARRKLQHADPQLVLDRDQELKSRRMVESEARSSRDITHRRLEHDGERVRAERAQPRRLQHMIDR